MKKNTTEYEFTWTPAPDMLLAIYGPITALVYGRVRRYCGMEKGYCNASRESMADWLGVSLSSVQKSLNVLRADGYLKDLTPEWKNKPHRYIHTRKLGIETGPWFEKKMEEKADKYLGDINGYKLALETQGLAQTTENESESDSEPLSGSKRTSEGVTKNLEDTIKDTNNIVEDINSEVGETKSVSPTSQAGKSNKDSIENLLSDYSPAKSEGIADGTAAFSTDRLAESDMEKYASIDGIKEHKEGYINELQWPNTEIQASFLQMLGLESFMSIDEKREVEKLEEKYPSVAKIEWSVKFAIEEGGVSTVQEAIRWIEENEERVLVYIEKRFAKNRENIQEILRDLREKQMHVK